MKWTCVLFDLDGTIANSAEGITESFAATLSELGLPVPPPDELRTWVGPPPAESFRVHFGFDDATAEHARQLYRQHYHRIGNADIQAFDEVLPALEALAQQGIPMAVATSKPEHTAIEVLGRLELARYFVTISGASRDETISDKASIVGEALRRLNADGVDTSNPVMVGDRLHDVVGAAEHDVPTILVGWGYGEPAEHTRALVTVGSADALTNVLLGR